MYFRNTKSFYLLIVYTYKGVINCMKKNKKDSILHIRINSDLKNKLYIYCFNNNISISRFITLFLNNFLDSYFEDLQHENY